ncbi:MAG: hypothetical protein H6587_04190 [Flavobacteriales bacterium]|nr:hypothetical protein [Flavobacteriales bacterium]MCB9363748.1 hypothetical protein [Flavobacteriales bacterium]
MKKLSILTSLVAFTFVSCKSTSSTSNTNNVKTEEVVKKSTETSPKKPTSLRSRTLLTE